MSSLFVKVRKIFRQKINYFFNCNLTPLDRLFQVYCIKPEGIHLVYKALYLLGKPLIIYEDFCVTLVIKAPIAYSRCHSNYLVKAFHIFTEIEPKKKN